MSLLDHYIFLQYVVPKLKHRDLFVITQSFCVMEICYRFFSPEAFDKME